VEEAQALDLKARATSSASGDMSPDDLVDNLSDWDGQARRHNLALAAALPQEERS